MQQHRLSSDTSYTAEYQIGNDSISSALASASTSSGSGSLSISSVNNLPAGQSLQQTIANLNVLRATAAPGSRNVYTRGKPADAVTLSSLPAVKATDFDSYVKSIQEEWANYQVNITPAAPQRGNTATSTLSVDTSLLNPTSNGIQQARPALPPLDQVPDLYMQEDFDLTLPRTFDRVAADAIPGSTSSDPTNQSSLGSLATDQMLQEKLSHYLDVVEMHLAHEISIRSSSFFSALSNLQSLHSQSELALTRLKPLKEELIQIDAASSRKGLALVAAGVRRRKLQSITASLDRIKEVWRAASQAGELALAGEWDGALEIVEEVEAAIGPAHSEDLSGHVDVPLSKITALAGLPKKLLAVRAQIGRALQAELVSVLSHELEERIPEYDQEGSWESFAVKEKASDRVRPLIRGLAKCGREPLEQSVASWRQSILSHIESISSLDSSIESNANMDATTHKNLALTPNNSESNIASLSHVDFLVRLKDIFNKTLATLEITQVHSQVLSSLIEDATPKSVTGSPHQVDVIAITSEIQDVVPASADLASGRLAKLVAARSETHCQLALVDFGDVVNSSWSFVLKCEVICQRMIVSLRGIIIGQAKAYLQSFHQRQLSASAKLVEEEQWSPVEVSSTDQHIAGLLVDCAVSNPRELLLHQSSTNGLSKTNPSKYIDIEGRQFFPVAASLACLKILLEYIRIVINISLVTTDSMGKVIEYLKQFNSRVCQVVLGAGAMRSAGLKNITAKHLALASQTLSIFISLIPYVREALRRHLNSKQSVMLVEFDKLKRDYQEHQNEIYAKLVAIMGDRLAVHCKTLQSIDWEKETSSQAETSGANTYMEALVKEATTLHKVLSKYMPGPALELVMMQVLSAITSRLAEEYGKIVLADGAAKERMIRDAVFLRMRLGDLKGLERTAPGADLEELIRGKPTTRKAPEPEMPTQSSAAPESPAQEVQMTESSLPETIKSPVSEPEVVPPASSTVSSLPTVTSPPRRDMKNRLGALFSKGPARTSPSSSTDRPVSTVSTSSTVASGVPTPSSNESIPAVSVSVSADRLATSPSAAVVVEEKEIPLADKLSETAGDENRPSLTGDQVPLPQMSEEEERSLLQESDMGEQDNGAAQDRIVEPGDPEGLDGVNR